MLIEALLIVTKAPVEDLTKVKKLQHLLLLGSATIVRDLQTLMTKASLSSVGI